MARYSAGENTARSEMDYNETTRPCSKSRVRQPDGLLAWQAQKRKKEAARQERLAAEETAREEASTSCPALDITSSQLSALSLRAAEYPAKHLSELCTCSWTGKRRCCGRSRGLLWLPRLRLQSGSKQTWRVLCGRSCC